MKLLINCGMLFILLFQQIVPPATVFAKQTSTSQSGAGSPGMVVAAPGFLQQGDDITSTPTPTSESDDGTPIPGTEPDESATPLPTEEALPTETDRKSVV